MTTSTLTWMERLADPDESAREFAVGELETCGPAAASDRTALLAVLQSSARSPLQAYWCITLLARDGSHAQAAEATAIAELLAPQQPLEVRQRAAWALGQLAPHAAATRQSLEQAANDPNPRLARLAQQALEKVAA